MISKEEQIRAGCIQAGATYHEGSYRKATEPFAFTCACGNPHRMLRANAFRPGSAIRCRACAAKAQSVATFEAGLRSGTLARLLQRCADSGATYVDGSYVGAHEPFSFICKCGVLAQTAVINFNSDRARVQCTPCANAARPRGETHPHWNPDLTTYDREVARWTKADSAWADEVRKRYDYRCAVTGEKSGELAAHHLLSKTRYPQYRLDPLNGIPILTRLHLEFHRAPPVGYGNKHFSPENFMAFFLAKTGRHLELPTHILGVSR